MMRSDVVPESDKITPVDERLSSCYLTKFEITRIVRDRANEISSGRFGLSDGSALDSVHIAHMCDNPLSLTVDPVMMAKYDLITRRIPCIVVRSFPNGRVENIPLQELLVDEEMLDMRV